jgi:hypothetical protein
VLSETLILVILQEILAWKFWSVLLKFSRLNCHFYIGIRICSTIFLRVFCIKLGTLHLINLLHPILYRLLISVLFRDYLLEIIKRSDVSSITINIFVTKDTTTFSSILISCTEKSTFVVQLFRGLKIIWPSWNTETCVSCKHYLLLYLSFERILDFFKFLS